MKWSIGLFLISCCLWSTACKPAKPNADLSPKPGLILNENGCQTLQLKQPKTDIQSIQSFTTHLEGDCLKLKVLFRGGCTENEFQLYWNGSWAESYPPQADLTLYRVGKEDTCTGIQSRLLSFDLIPLRYSGVGQLILTLHAEGLNIQRINYTY